MRYAQIRKLDISNGEGVGISLFVQGCHFHCNNCFNPETWDFNGGKEWTEEVENKFLELAARPYIKRISILGGEPLADENLDGVLNLVNKIRLLFGNAKTIWLYTGYTFDFLQKKYIENMYVEYERDILSIEAHQWVRRWKIISKCDVLVDGRYIDSQRDITLQWKGSSNQRVIDTQQSLQKGEIILWQT